jgi:magnesium transporter
VLESYLLSTASTLEGEMVLLRGQVQMLLSELEEEISRDSLKGLLSLGRDLTGLGERSGLVNDAVERCLNDGASIAYVLLIVELILRRALAARSIDDVLVQFDLSGANLGATELGGMDDIELLLESFSQRIEEVISEVQTTTVRARA